MIVLNRKNREKAEKLLTAILIICNKGDMADPETYAKLIENIGELAFLVGGIKSLHRVGDAAFNFYR